MSDARSHMGAASLCHGVTMLLLARIRELAGASIKDHETNE
jgi:hypothetical protein